MNERCFCFHFDTMALKYRDASAESVILPITGFGRRNVPSRCRSDSSPDNQAKAHGTNGTHLERCTLEDVQA